MEKLFVGYYVKMSGNQGCSTSTSHRQLKFETVRNMGRSTCEWNTNARAERNSFCRRVEIRIPGKFLTSWNGSVRSVLRFRCASFRQSRMEKRKNIAGPSPSARVSSRVNRRKTVSTRCMHQGNRERNTRAHRFSLCPFFLLFSRSKPFSFCSTRDGTFEEDKIRSTGKPKVEENQTSKDFRSIDFSELSSSLKPDVEVVWNPARK